MNRFCPLQMFQVDGLPDLSQAERSRSGCALIMLRQMQGFDPTGLTGHGLKATTLSMLSKFGASEEVRLVLGHHSLRKKSTLESYSRGIQAAPLRVLESMFLAIKKGQFHPDMTRSGMVGEQHLQQSYNSFLGVGRTGSDVQVIGVGALSTSK